MEQSILPIPTWETVNIVRQQVQEIQYTKNLTLVVLEMTRRSCKGIGDVHRDEMAATKGIVLCKRTGELVGLKDVNIGRVEY